MTPHRYLRISISEPVKQWQLKLEKIALLSPTIFTKKQVVEALIDTIEKALEMRSYRKVAKQLKTKGLDISEGSLKQYVSRYRRAHLTTAATKGQKQRVKDQKKVTAKAQPKTDTVALVEADKAVDVVSTQPSTRYGEHPFLEMDEENL